MILVPYISKMEQITSIFIGQGKIMSHHLKIINSQYLSEFWRYGPDFLHVIITFIGFKITFNNMGSKVAPSLISRGGSLRHPPPVAATESDMPYEVGLNRGT